VSALTRGQPLSLAHIPVDRVIRLAGLTDEQLTVSLDPLPDGAPVVIRYRIDRPGLSQHHVVDDALTGLENVGLNLYPAWLPDSGAITTSSDFDLRVIRELAYRHAADSTHFGPFLADMAEAAQAGRVPDRRLGPEVRAIGLARIIADSYQRAGVVLLVGPTAVTVSEREQRRIAVAFEWLAQQGIGVWLTGGVLPLVDRYPIWRLPVPEHVDALLAAESVEPSPQLGHPPLAGMPHPASVAEQKLERCLARREWAAGRTWNQQYASHSLAPPIRVDLMWPTERCAVEIDGPEHRGSLKYAADRRRDNGLMLDGFAVLRFTNAEILDDPAQVLAVIESLLSNKRHDEGNLP
jgi:very-short-patch-repair endonuclease